jgi:hypothetical protein
VKIIFLFLISFSLIVNPTITHSKATKTILEKTEFYEIISCYPKINSFEEFSLCIDNQTMTSQKLGLLKKKKKREIYDMVAIVNILNEGVKEGFIDDKTAYKNWSQFINSNYKKRTSKQKLKKILDESKCENSKDYQSFIICFNNEFRSYDIYQSADIKTKERMEHIVFNSLILIKPDGLVYTLKKENIYGMEEFDQLYEEGDGYEFFFTLMNALGTDYFKKTGDDVDWKKIIKFIVIAIIVAYLAKSLLKLSGSSGTTASSSSSAASSTSTSSYSLLYSGFPAQGKFGKGMFRYAPKTSVLQKSWFKYTFGRGGFF